MSTPQPANGVTQVVADGPGGHDTLDNHEPHVQPEGLRPLPGELGIPNVARTSRWPLPGKGLVALALLVLSLIVAAGLSMQRWLGQRQAATQAQAEKLQDKPAAATIEPRRLELPGSAVAASAPFPRVQSAASTDLHASAPGPVQPVAVRDLPPGAVTGPEPRTTPAEDAPVLLASARTGVAGLNPTVSPIPYFAPLPSPGSVRPTGSEGTDPNDPLAATTRNLQAYQRQLQGLLDNLAKAAAVAGGIPTPPSPDLPAPGIPTGALLGVPPSGATPLGGLGGGAPPSPPTHLVGQGGLFGGQLPGSTTPRVSATMLGDRSLTLPKGTAFTCALKTRVISAVAGLVGCQVQRNVYSDDGRVLLVERGSHLDGEYRVSSVRPGMVRIPVLWTRIRTPFGVTVEIDSPATGPLGESGIDGHVDNRWVERIGAAMLLSLIDDSVKLVIQHQASDNASASGNTVVLPSTTANTSRLAEKVLDSTINIPPLIYQNQGGIVGIYVARDVDFSQVYALVPR